MNIKEFAAFVAAFICFVGKSTSDTAGNQLPRWKEKNSNVEKVTDQKGVPVPSMTAVLTAGKDGPILLEDSNFIDHMAHFDRERIPERVVHAKGAGAFGEFEVTHDITKYSKAKVFERVGKKWPMLVRFSSVSAELGSADTVNDPRGFALKFYTDDGNWDLVGNNIPNFPIRDPFMFPNFVHSRKRNPQTGLFDANMFWDFVSLRHETVFHTIFQFTGIPDGHRKMDGFGVHTFKLVNKDGEAVYTKFHWTSGQGVHYLDWSNASVVAGSDPDYGRRDLYNAIADGNFPTWNLAIQVMTFEQAEKYQWNPFDITKLWRITDFPLIPVGKITLNRNPTNQFEDIEQAAFHPGNLVPGIETSPDRMLHGRMFSYADSQRYRLGINFPEIPVNRPNVKVNTFMRDGHSVAVPKGSGPNYFPNSYNGPELNPQGKQSVYKLKAGDVIRFDTGEDDNYSLATWHYNDVMTRKEKDCLAHNIVSLLSQAEARIQQRALEMYGKVSRDLKSDLEKVLSQHVLP